MKAHLKSKKIKYTGTNEAYLIELEGGLRGIFKPEEDLWSSYGEVMAYEISKLLGVSFVPPTVLREIDGRTGSLQMLIENSYDPYGDTKKRNAQFDALSEKQKSNFAIFHYLVNQWDRHWGNIIIESGSIYSIDNEVVRGYSVSQFGQYPFLRRGGSAKAVAYGYDDIQGFPFDKAQQIDDLSLGNLESLFAGYMKPEKILRHYKKYQRKNLEHINVVFWKGYAWIQVPRKSMGPAHTEVFSEETLAKLNSLTRESLVQNVSLELDDQQIASIMVRRDQILEAAKHGTLIP